MHSKVLWLLATLAWVAVAAADDLELPALELPATVDLVAASTLSLDLERSLVEVVVDPQARPSLRARRISEKGPAARLTVEDAGGTLRIRRRVEEPGERRLRFDLVIRPDQALELVGRELEVVIKAPSAEPAGTEAPPADPPPERVAASGDDLESRFQGLAWPYQVRLTASTAELAGLTGLRLEAAGSDVQLRETRGPMVVSLEGGSLASEDHQGDVRLTSSDCKSELTRHQGGMLFDIRGGELAVLTAEGTFRGEADGGSVSLIDWTGRAIFTGRSSRFEIRDGRDAAEVTLAGSALDVAVTRLDGNLAAELDGGRLTGSALGGNLEVDARNEARISLTELDGESASFTLSSGAGADLLDVESELEAEITAGARLEVDGVRQLAAKVVDGEIVADHIEVVRMISLKNSRFDLDFTQLRRHPAIAQRGTTAGRLKLAQPCVVRIAGPVEVIDERVVVTGCDLVTLASRKEERMRGQRGYPEGTTVLVTNIEKDSGSLEIDGVVVP